MLIERGQISIHKWENRSEQRVTHKLEEFPKGRAGLTIAVICPFQDPDVTMNGLLVAEATPAADAKN